MPFDGVTLGFVARELREKLIGGRVDRVSQPERDEIHLLIRSQGENLRLLLCAGANAARVHLTAAAKQNPMEPPMLCMLLRKYLQGGRVTDVRRVNGDRILEIDVEALDELGELKTRTLIAEIMGRHSNIILRGADGRIIDAVRHVSEEISRVREVLPGLPYAYPPTQDKLNPDTATAEAFEDMLRRAGGRLSKALQGGITGISPQAAREIAFRLTGSIDTHLEDVAIPALSQRLCALLSGLYDLRPPVLLLGEDGESVDVFPYPQLNLAGAALREVPEGISHALDLLFLGRDRRERMAQRSASLHRTLKTHIERCEKKLAIQLEALENSRRMEEYRVNGELIQANLYRLEKGMEEAAVENFYSPSYETVTIPLDKKLTPVQNAQRYFKLYQKARSAREMAAEQKKKTETELRYLEEQLDDLRKCTQPEELSEIRAMLEQSGHVRKVQSRVKQRKAQPSQPFHYRASDGTDILVGKNSVQNDRLTGEARGDETWLHAKNMPGSHVIICSQKVSEQTLREAANLAAFYSKGQQSSQVPIDYTLRRYVKKPGGAPAGFVIYTNQKTLYVTPDEHAVKRLTLVSG